MIYDALVDKDGNGVPIYGDSPFKVSKELTINANNTTVNPPIFTITGTVLITKIWGVVTADLGVNHTASSLRINDQTIQVYLTAIGGTALSAIKAGSVIAKTGLVATAITKIDNAAGAIAEPATAQTIDFTPVIITKKTSALTQIEYRYATTDQPTTGKIKFYCTYLPLSDNGLIQAV